MAKCERCNQPVLEFNYGGERWELSVEPTTGIRLDQKHPEDVSYLTGRVVQIHTPHFCRDTK